MPESVQRGKVLREDLSENRRKAVAHDDYFHRVLACAIFTPRRLRIDFICRSRAWSFSSFRCVYFPYCTYVVRLVKSYDPLGGFHRFGFSRTCVFVVFACSLSLMTLIILPVRTCHILCPWLLLMRSTLYAFDACSRFSRTQLSCKFWSMTIRIYFV